MVFQVHMVVGRIHFLAAVELIKTCCSKTSMGREGGRDEGREGRKKGGKGGERKRDRERQRETPVSSSS